MSTPEDFAALQSVAPIEESAGIFSRMRESVALRTGAIVLSIGGLTAGGEAVAHASPSSHATETVSAEQSHESVASQTPTFTVKILKRLVYNEYAQLNFHNYTKSLVHYTTLDYGHVHHYTAGNYQEAQQVSPVPVGTHMEKVYMGTFTKAELSAHPKKGLIAERMLHRKPKK